MELIKKVWRGYLARKKTRWEQLNALWTSCLEDIIRDLSKPVKQSRRPVRKKKDATIKYMEITSSQKTQLLTGIMLAARRRYRERLRAYLNSQHDLIRKGVKAFQSTLEGSGECLLALPDFSFLPSREEMKGVIEKATVSAGPKK